MAKRKNRYFFGICLFFFALHISYFIFKGFLSNFCFNALGLFTMNALGISLSVLAAYNYSKSDFKRNHLPVLLILLITLYVINLAIIYFGYSYSFGIIEHTNFSDYAKVSINLVPFEELQTGINMRSLYLMIGVITLALPIGFFTSLINVARKKIIISLLVSLITGIAIEGLQLITMLGRFDVTEIILFVIGGQVGHYLFCRLGMKEYLKRYNLIYNLNMLKK